MSILNILKPNKEIKAKVQKLEKTLIKSARVQESLALKLSDVINQENQFVGNSYRKYETCFIIFLQNRGVSILPHGLQPWGNAGCLCRKN